MTFNQETKVLRIFISNTDKFKHKPLYEVLVYSAKRFGISGATVLKGIMGYGSSSVIHSNKFWEISDKLPLVIEMIDDAEKIDKFCAKILPWFEIIKTGALITCEKTNVILYKKGSKKGIFEI